MTFIEITEKEYEKFWENHPQKTFLSSNKIATIREKSNWNHYFVGVKKNKKLIAAAMLLSHKRKFNVYEFYSPRGFLLNYKDKELLDFFTEEVKKFVKEKKGYSLRIDPYIIYKERDINGDIVEDGENNEDVKKHLLELGYKEIPSKDKEQVGWMFSLDIDGKTAEEILKEMKSNTRNTIRKAEKLGIIVTELKYDELERFQNIMIETSERKGFIPRKLSYYQEMYKLFHDSGEIKFLVTELNLKENSDKLREEIKEKEEKISKLSDSPHNDKAKNNLREEIETLEKRINHNEEIMKEKNTDIITLSGSMFMLVKPEVLYLFSGNYEEYMKFDSQYLIQWELIKYGIKNGFKKHNFYGIPENINTHPKDYGIYKFKKGFNGYVEELIGEYELPITYHYNLFKVIRKLKFW